MLGVVPSRCKSVAVLVLLVPELASRRVRHESYGVEVSAGAETNGREIKDLVGVATGSGLVIVGRQHSLYVGGCFVHIDPYILRHEVVSHE